MSDRHDTGRGIRIERLAKTYPGVRALDDVTLAIAPGTIHGLVGENGAGKSTLMKAVAGALRADAGRIFVNGREVDGDVHRAAVAGVAMIYQELTIVPELDAVQNVLLGALPNRLGVIDRKRAMTRFREVARIVGSDIPPRAKAGDLSTSAQQTLEIMRAVASGRDILIMDEPTASLGPADTERLHAVMNDLVAQGATVVYISHDLDAVLSVCHAVTVMREGRVVETRQAADWSTAGLIGAMIGTVPLSAAGASHRDHADESIAVRIRGLTAPGVDLEGLDIRRGEIIGLAGLVGSGRTRLLRAIAGADRATTGELQIDGRDVPWPATPRAALRQGILLAPEDRKSQGLVLGRTASWNIALGRFGRTSLHGRAVTNRRIRRWAEPYADAVGFASSRLGTEAGGLSGGNQQKLILARLAAQDARCILLDEPTRGIDIGAKAQIFDTVRELVDAGRSVIWCSSDLHEVAQHSDRIVVLAGGRAVATLPGRTPVREILDHAFSTRKSAAA